MISQHGGGGVVERGEFRDQDRRGKGVVGIAGDEMETLARGAGLCVMCV